jgi:hypothetical protein
VQVDPHAKCGKAGRTRGEQRHREAHQIPAKRLPREGTRCVLQSQKMQGSVRGRRECSRNGPAETDNSVAIGEVAEDGEINSVDAGENEGDAHNRTHPVTSALAEGENEGAGRENEPSDEGSVQSSLRTASRDMFSVESLLIEVGAESNEGSNAASRGRKSQSPERGGWRKD